MTPGCGVDEMTPSEEATALYQELPSLDAATQLELAIMLLDELELSDAERDRVKEAT